MHITTKSGRKILLNTDEEDAEITRQVIEDGTHHTDEELAQFRPASEFKELAPLLKSAGRPKAEQTKIPISIRLSPDVIDAFKTTGAGWQTRIDEALKEWLKEHPV